MVVSSNRKHLSTARPTQRDGRTRRNHRVTITQTKRIGALALAAAFVLGACSSGGGATTAPSVAPASDAPASTEPSSAAPALSGTVTIDGSSTVFPITAAVAEDFQVANPGVQVPTALS